MNRKDFFFLGKALKTSGYKGHLVFFFDVDDITQYLDLDALFIDVHGDFIPFAIESIRMEKEKNVLVKLEDVDSDEQAIVLVGCELYLPMDYLPELSGDQFYFHEIKGFKVIDREKGEIGIIDSVLEHQVQPVFQVKYGNKEILIPVTDDIIKKVDRDSKTITVEAPHGLIDLYLE